MYNIIPLSVFDYKNYDEYMLQNQNLNLRDRKLQVNLVWDIIKNMKILKIGLRMKMGEFIENEKGIMDKVNFDKSEKIDKVEYPDINYNSFWREK